MKIKNDDIEIQNLTIRYLKGQLSPEETIAFEEYILDKPELLEQLELDSVLIKTLPQIEESRAKESFFTKLLSSWLIVLPTACSFIFLAMLVMNHNPDIQETASQIHYLENLRSANQSRIETVTIEEDTGILVLVVTPLILSDMHQVTLINADGLAYNKQQKLSDFGQLSILIEKSVFERGEATLKVEPLTNVSNTSGSTMEIDLVFISDN